MQNLIDEEVLRQLRAGLSDKTKADTFIANLQAMASALNGDMVMEISPSAVTLAPTGDAWTRTVTITFKDSLGNVMTWLTETIATILSIGDTSTAGTASITSTSIVIVRGVATVVVSGDAAAWLDTETDTLTVANVTPQQLAVAITGGTSVQTITA